MCVVYSVTSYKMLKSDANSGYNNYNYNYNCESYIQYSIALGNIFVIMTNYIVHSRSKTCLRTCVNT